MSCDLIFGKARYEVDPTQKRRREDFIDHVGRSQAHWRATLALWQERAWPDRHFMGDLMRLD